MRVQRVVSPDEEAESWTVLGEDLAPVEPVELFLAHLSDQGRSPNTVKAYAHDLKDYFAYLNGRGAHWRRLRFDELAGFKPRLRLSPGQRRGGVAALPSATPFCTASTVNRKIAAITSFYEFHARHGVQVAALIREASRPLTMSRSSFRPFLVHTRRDPPRRSGLTVRRPQRRPQVLSDDEVEALFAGCTRLRERQPGSPSTDRRAPRGTNVPAGPPCWSASPR
ncbi:site-specific integrase [Pseudonocardia sp. DSM 110487]|uniref:site-specific integrase n=1 Tax=Pseudonocardia sp. DSM 110487 TaxID=2865833 RepID=UPI001C6A6145|nr:site-specific integrase [Pseudonocardia sp. DSM 110487]QYN33493.1 site-specific integrase [Pseudonocardia sp. DSM 110487]